MQATAAAIIINGKKYLFLRLPKRLSGKCQYVLPIRPHFRGM